MDIERFQDELAHLFHPEPDEDGLLPNEHPHRRLTQTHLLDFAYMRQLSWEGSSMHRYTRLCPPDHAALTVLMQNHGTPDRLFGAALRLMGDSIVAYHGKEDRLGEIRFYPPVVLTFWSGFETFVRYSSELLIATAQSLPAEVVRFLRDQEAEVRLDGEVVERTRHRSVLARYRVFLKYAYG